MPDDRPLPTTIGRIAVPQDDISAATWAWAQRTLPAYLFAHSVRAYCWGATIAAQQDLAFDPQVLWTASLFHDVGLTRLPANTMCFEVEGGEIARRFLERQGLSPALADRVAIAIVLHMRAGVTLDDGAEALLLDQATSIDVRGDGYATIDGVRDAVVRDFPRGPFDRHFLAAIEREASRRPTCQSARLLHETDLAGWMARSPWRGPSNASQTGRAGAAERSLARAGRASGSVGGALR